MARTIVIIALCVSGFFTVHAQADAQTALAGVQQKVWQLIKKSPGDVQQTCSADHAISRDNTYTFFADGSFQFDNGTVTEDPDCKEPGCCSDFKDLVGKWEMNATQKTLKVISLRAGEKEIEPTTLFDAKVEILTEEVLKISFRDPGNNNVYSYEFRKQ